jgi:hypothetical protein
MSQRGAERFQDPKGSSDADSTSPRALRLPDPSPFGTSAGLTLYLGAHSNEYTRAVGARLNPRDSVVAGVVRIHRMIRRGTSYGPPLPEGVLEDDGVDRGLMFAFVGAHLGR